MVRRVVRIAIVGWLVGAGVQWVRRSGRIVPKVQRMIRRHRDAPASARGRAWKKGGTVPPKEAARAELAAVATREAASVRRAARVAPDTGTGAGPATEVEAVPGPEAASAGDDLKIIEGVGPKIEGVFHEAGVTSFQRVADLGTEGIETILRDAGVRASPGTWPDQARLAARGEWDALAEWQAQLKGGREVTPD